MNTENFKKSFQKRRFKSGSYSTVLIVIVLAIVIVVNLFANELGLKFDVSKEQRYSITSDTKNILKNLKTDITIYLIAQTGKENEDIVQMLDSYQKASDKIKVVYKDPILYPMFLKDYVEDIESVQANSVIVESDRSFKVINYYDMLNINYDQYYQPYVQSVDIEGKITSAIAYVSLEKIPVLYEVTGHNETLLDELVVQAIEEDNITYKQLNLLTEEKVPEDASCILLNAPQRDYSKEETQKIMDYLENGGRAIVISNYSPQRLINFENIIKNYGLELVDGIVIEGNAYRYIQGAPNFLLPQLKSHDIVAPISENGLNIIFPNAQGLREMELKRKGITIESLLETSKSAYSKVNVYSTTIEKEEGDINGPFSVAVAVTEDTQDGKTKLVVASTGLFLEINTLQYSAGSNLDFLLNSIQWLSADDTANPMGIRARSEIPDYIHVSDGQARTWKIITIVLIPVSILSYGFYVWYRRNKK